MKQIKLLLCKCLKTFHLEVGCHGETNVECLLVVMETNLDFHVTIPNIHGLHIFLNTTNIN